MMIQETRDNPSGPIQTCAICIANNIKLILISYLLMIAILIVDYCD